MQYQMFLLSIISKYIYVCSLAGMKNQSIPWHGLFRRIIDSFSIARIRNDGV